MEGPNVNTLTGGVMFSRSVKVRDYETAKAEIWINFEIPNDDSLSAEELNDFIVSNARASFFTAKGLVFEELGLEFTVSDNGVIQEVLKKNFGNVTEVISAPSHTPAAISAPAAAEGGDMPPYSIDTQDKGERAANKTWAVARWNANPDEFWDNRANKRNPKGPDLKHKTTGLAVWLS